MPGVPDISTRPGGLGLDYAARMNRRGHDMGQHRTRTRGAHGRRPWGAKPAASLAPPSPAGRGGGKGRTRRSSACTKQARQGEQRRPPATSQPAARNPSSAQRRTAQSAAKTPAGGAERKQAGVHARSKAPGRKAGEGRPTAAQRPGAGAMPPPKPQRGRPERKPRTPQGAQARAEAARATARKPADGRRTGQTNCGGSTDHGARKRAHGRGE